MFAARHLGFDYRRALRDAGIPPDRWELYGANGIRLADGTIAVREYDEHTGWMEIRVTRAE